MITMEDGRLQGSNRRHSPMGNNYRANHNYINLLSYYNGQIGEIGEPMTIRPLKAADDHTHKGQVG